ncbi:MAG: IPT/TIG domain-containing protein [Bryobacterales bacterium]|nr:IPT/TIG domain-containing protein [Bryobacterales bacterium]
MIPLLLWLSSSIAAAAPPAIAVNGISNAASRIPSTLPGGTLARGARILIEGIRFGAAPSAVTVTIRGPQRALNAQVLAVTPTAIEVRLPPDAEPGPAKLSVTVAGEQSPEQPVTIVASNAGLYSRNGLGWGPAAATNLAGPTRTANGPLRPARPGDAIALQTTGLGAATPLHAIIGGAPAKIRSIRRNIRPSIDEVLIEIPPKPTEGCFVPLRLPTPAHATNTVTVAIASAGPCPPSPAFPMAHWKPGPSAVLLAGRVHSRETGDSTPQIVDEILAAFFDFNPALGISSPLLYGLPAGGCTLVTAAVPDAASQSVLAFLLGKPGQGIDAGPSITANNGRIQRRIPQTPAAPGLFRATLSGKATPRIGERPLPLLLDSGALQIRIPASPTLGDFTVALVTAPPLQWNAQDVIHSTAAPLTVEWRTPDSNRLVLAAASAISPTLSTAVCLCLQTAARGTVTIPQDLMAHLPASRQTPGQPPGRVTLISWPQQMPPPIRARGLVNSESIAISVTQSGVLFR